MEKNLYDILEINEEERKLQGKEFQDVCKRNFKRLSKQWHPDKWTNASEEEKKKAEEMFKDIANANTILSDETKRQQYDFQQNGGGDWGYPDMDDMMFGNFRRYQPMTTKGQDISITLEITLEESYNGVTKELLINKPVTCHHCNGTGSEDGQKHPCPHCNGTGMLRQVQKRGNMTTVYQSMCPHCNGTGQEVTNKCKHCNGSGIEYQKVREKIEIPKGMFEGTLNLPGRGGESPDGGPNGMLFVNVKVKKHEKFERIGNNLVYSDKQPFNKVMLGYKGEVKILNGETIKYTVPELAHDKQKITFNGKGMPVLNAYGQNVGFGDFVIHIDYIYPDKLTNKQKEILTNF